MVEVFRGVWRVLRDDGILWLNLGSSYAQSGGSGSSKEYQRRHKQFGKVIEKGTIQKPRIAPMGYKPKDLIMIPFLVAWALQQDGWYLRSVIPWLKNSAMPESVTDRPSSAVEYFFLLSKSQKYFYDIEATRMPVAKSTVTRATAQNNADKRKDSGGAKWQGGLTPKQQDDYYSNINSNTGRNRRNSDWFMDSIKDILKGMSGTLLHDENGLPIAVFCNPHSYKGAHFATFSTRLITPMILAGSSPRACEKCGAPWERIVKYKNLNKQEPGGKLKEIKLSGYRNDGNIRMGDVISETTGWQSTCKCKNEGKGRCIVLDPFAGSGTTLFVAEHYGRDSIGIELNPDYVKLIEERMNNFQQTIFNLTGVQ